MNGIDVSMKSVNTVEQLLADQISSYSLIIEGRNDLTETLQASDINLTYLSNNDVGSLLENQNSFLWVKSLFQSQVNESAHCISYDQVALENFCKNSSFAQKANTVAPKNAKITYVKNEGFQIIPEDSGAKIDKDGFLQTVKEAVDELDEALVLDGTISYKNPSLTSNSPELLELFQKVQKYSETSLVYSFGEDTVTLDSSVFHSWIKINTQKNSVKINSNKVRKYVDKLARKYNSYGTTRSFKASTGNKVSVSGGDYGWLMDRETETKQIIKCIKKGVSKNKKPAYTQKAASYGSKDWGKTFVEINLTAQHLWYYKNGKLVVDSDFVSGNVRTGCSTPQGCYSINYRERDAILGQRSNASYRTPVKYWMPFNKGIGLHDANWRRSFGGKIYQTNGSHGCINLPPAIAGEIFENIKAGVPVICYYDPNFEPSQLEPKEEKKKKTNDSDSNE